MTKVTVMRRNSDGSFSEVKDGESDVVPTGGLVRVPMMLMDSASGMRCGQISDEDRQKREARLAAYEARLTDAWRNPPPLVSDAAAPVSKIADCYARYEAAIQQRWRGAA